MAKFRIGFRRLAALTLLGGLSQAGMAAPTVEQILAYKPKQPGVEVTTPTDVASCTVELEKGAALPGGKQATAWVLKDGKGHVLRKFHDTTGAGGVNLFAYYRDGDEAYREMDTNANAKVDQYRWLGPNGSRWGVDADEDGTIDSWSVISPEEVSQELLTAVVTKDAKKLEALLLTPAELTAMGLPPAEADRIKAKLGQAGAQFKKTCQELAALKPETIWVHLETKAPQTIAADALGAKADLVRYRHATILYQEGEGKASQHNWIQTGEMIQVGRAWRVVQAPIPGMDAPPEAGPAGPSDGRNITIPPGAEKLVEQLNELDKAGPGGTDRAKVVAFNLRRAQILEQIAGLFTKAEDRPNRDVWLKQVAECYAAAAQQGDKSALGRLTDWRTALAKDPAGIALPYFAFREMSADYAQKLPTVNNDVEKLNKLQEGWRDTLAKFIEDFPKADDAPDAMLQLGMVNEFFGPRTEGEARKAYGRLVRDFPTHPMAKRAQGCLDRLSLEGKELDLNGPTLNGGAAFSIAALQGKAVVVYYWASWNDLATSDFNKIKQAMKDHAGKVELVGVNLDGKAADAAAFLQANAVGGTHVHLPGGLESPLAVRYGITALPVLFLVGPDGKVVSRHVQASTLEDELKRVLKTAPMKDKDK